MKTVKVVVEFEVPDDIDSCAIYQFVRTILKDADCKDIDKAIGEDLDPKVYFTID